MRNVRKCPEFFLNVKIFFILINVTINLQKYLTHALRFKSFSSLLIFLKVNDKKLVVNTTFFLSFPVIICVSFVICYLQGRRKQLKVGWDNFMIHYIAADKNDKIHILPKQTICITKRKQNYCFGIIGAKRELTMA